MAQAPKPKHHAFHGEMKIRVNKKLYPNADEQDVMELAQRVLEGEVVPGTEIQKFEVRDEDETDVVDTGDYAFASAFMRSAKPATSGKEVESAKNKKRK